MADPGDYTPRPEDEEPIAELATLVEAAPTTLSQRIRGSIQRRLLAADVVELSLSQIFHVFIEFLKVTFESLQSGSQARGREE